MQNCYRPVSYKFFITCKLIVYEKVREVFVAYFHKALLCRFITVDRIYKVFCVGTINMQKCYSRRNCLNYVSKKDKKVYFNCG